jgi:hypothetical protein
MNRLKGVRKLCVSHLHLSDETNSEVTFAVYAVGLTEKNIKNPQVGISPVWWEGKIRFPSRAFMDE